MVAHGTRGAVNTGVISGPSTVVSAASFPRTLIQLHYHDRPCGVTQVMRWYAKAFGAVAGPEAVTLVACAHDKSAVYPEFPAESMIHLPEAAYRTYHSASGFYKTRRIIADWLFALLLSLEGRGPVVIAAHNLMLCKNAALLSAFVHVARLFSGQTDRYRFFSIVHDCAEQGRVDLLEEIGQLERMGIPIGEDLSVADTAVQQVAVNKTVAGVLCRAGYHTSFLFNPVVGEGECLTARRNAENRDRFFSYCEKRGVAADRGKRLYAFPARTIARKNPIEAVALACVAGGANLLLGPSGVSKRDRQAHAVIKKMAEKHHLPVVTDIQEVMKRITGQGGNPVPSIYGIADAALTASVAESFGYLLYEPYIYGTPVVGRKPAGRCNLSSIAGGHLYTRLPVPKQWVELDAMRKRFRSIGNRCFDSLPQKQLFSHRLEKLINGATVDFALLDDRMQMDLIDKLCGSERLMEVWRTLLKEKQPGWPGLASVLTGSSSFTVEQNRGFMAWELSFNHFARAFGKCFSSVPQVMNRGGNRKRVRDAFIDPTIFRVR
jgi:hypothetical protein